MKEAIFEAKMGLNEGGIPIGSVIVYQDKIIGRGHNQRVQNGNPLLHGKWMHFKMLEDWIVQYIRNVLFIVLYLHA